MGPKMNRKLFYFSMKKDEMHAEDPMYAYVASRIKTKTKSVSISSTRNFSVYEEKCTKFLPLNDFFKRASYNFKV